MIRLTQPVASGASTPLLSSFRTSDPEEARAFIGVAYGETDVRLGGSTRDFSLEQSRLDLGSVRLDTFANTLNTEYQIESLESLIIVRVLTGTLELDGLVPQRLGIGDVAISNRPGQAVRSRTAGLRVQVAGIDASLVAGVIDEAVEETLARLRPDVLPASQAAFWLRTVDFVERAVTNAPGMSDQPLVVGGMRRLLATAALASFDPRLDARPSGHADATPTAVRLAISYLETNADLDITVADVARAAHVSVRSLQLAFRRHLDTSPMAYLRRIRMDQARAELGAADPGAGATVSRVAARWGFTDASRFGARYRDTYGESPRDTLHR